MVTRQYRVPRKPRGAGRGPGRRDDGLLNLLRPGNLRLISALIIAALAAFGLLPPGEIRGPAEVIDGDTVIIGGHDHVRLYGIDAPELDQPCRNGGSCGRRAEAHLTRLVGSRMLTCHKRGADRYGREVAQCFIAEKDDKGNVVHGDDIGRAMVRDGQAMAYRSITELYVPDEPKSFDFTPPWNWREQHGTRQTK